MIKVVPTKTLFDCRNKVTQILQVIFRNNDGLDDVLVDFLELQHASEESQINWKKWQSRDFSPEEGRNRLMILKKLIEGRSKKEFPAILQEIRNKVSKKKSG
jgi:predicted component of type VI protein secretion system